MKKLLLVSFLIFAIALVGCEKKIEEPKTNEETIVVEETTLSFDERTKEAREWMNQEDKYGIEELGHVSLEHFVSKASMEKKDDDYVMKLQFSSSKIYDRADVEEMARKADEDGIDHDISFDGNDDEYREALESSYERIKNDPSVIFLDGNIRYQVTPKDSTKCCADEITFAGGADGFVITEVEKEMEVVLYPEDRMLIVPVVDEEGAGKELTVEAFYKKAIKNETSSDDLIYGFKYDLSNIGDYLDEFAGYTNAIRFEDGKIIVNYKNGGV